MPPAPVNEDELDEESPEEEEIIPLLQFGDEVEGRGSSQEATGFTPSPQCSCPEVEGFYCPMLVTMRRSPTSSDEEYPAFGPDYTAEDLAEFEQWQA